MGILFSFKGPQHFPVCLKGSLINIDANKMSQVFRNIISNALKFTPRGGSIDICASLCHSLEDFDSEPNQFLPNLKSVGELCQISTKSSDIENQNVFNELDLPQYVRIDFRDSGCGLSKVIKKYV